MERKGDRDLKTSEMRSDETRPDARSSWDGTDRRKSPYHYEVMDMIREEMEDRDEKILRRLEVMSDNQDEIKKKIQQWETGASIVRWMAISTVGIVSATMAAIDWIKVHVK